MKGDEKSSPFLQYVTFSTIFQQFFISHKQQSDFMDLHNYGELLIYVQTNTCT